MQIRNAWPVVALICLLLAGASCTGGSSDPLIGEWQLGGGAVLSFSGKQASCATEGKDPFFDGAAGRKWTATWKREKDVLTIETPAGTSIKARRFLILKLEHGELTLRSLRDKSLLTAARAR